MRFKDDGAELEVIRVRHNRVEIRTSFLNRYLAARQLALVLQIESDFWHPYSKDEAAPALPEERRSDLTRVPAGESAAHCRA